MCGFTHNAPISIFPFFYVYPSYVSIAPSSVIYVRCFFGAALPLYLYLLSLPKENTQHVFAFLDSLLCNAFVPPNYGRREYVFCPYLPPFTSCTERKTKEKY